MPSNPAHRSGPSRRQSLCRVAAGVVAVWLPARRAEAAYLVKPWPADRKAPKLELTDLDGKAWNLARLKGRAVLLNFWATWCEPCRGEMPSLEQLAGRHRRDGLTVLSVNYKEAAPVIRRFLEQSPFGLPILLDSDGAATLGWTPKVFPTTVMIDRRGVPQMSVVGELDWTGAVARDLIEPLLGVARRSSDTAQREAAWGR